MGSELKDDQPSGAAEENSTGKAKRNKVLAEGKDMTYANGAVKDKVKMAGPTEVEVQSAAGAKVGDIFLSIIATCQLNKANPHEYLTVIQHHIEAFKAAPADWMPWSFKESLNRIRDPVAAQ